MGESLSVLFCIYKGDMERITKSIYAEAIGAAFDLLPPSVEARLRYIHFFTGDPIYAGLHTYESIGDGRSYHNTAHACLATLGCFVDSRERTTIVLPTLDAATPRTVIHELGHCLDEVLGFEHIALPINAYAKTNRQEAFAEAFVAQYFWLGTKAEDIFQSDKATRYLFKQLEA